MKNPQILVSRTLCLIGLVAGLYCSENAWQGIVICFLYFSAWPNEPLE
jgi:hypothetical protein